MPVRDTPTTLFSKTISESDVYLFAGLTGYFYPVHVDAVYAAAQPVGQRIAHGVLVLGLMSAAAAHWACREGIDILSAGYDRIRFVKTVLFGDTVTVAYAPPGDCSGRRRIVCSVEARNQDDNVVAVARHIVQVVRRGPRQATAPR